MKTALCFLFISPLFVAAHPGVGIVKDSKGNIFYTDLVHVWKISKGIKSMAVPHVHTHELFLDADDNLYGEDERYEGEATDRYFHYMWKRSPEGTLDTLIGTRQAYIKNDYSLARDKKGNSYFIDLSDSSKIYKILSDGTKTFFAEGKFSGVKFLHVQNDGSILFVLKNDVFGIDSLGSVKIIAENVVSDNISLWSVWRDNMKNIYVSVISDRMVKRIDLTGKVTEYCISETRWFPVHGVFDDDNKLWVLEYSDKNEVRVKAADFLPVLNVHKNKSGLIPLLLLACIGITGIVFFYKKKQRRDPSTAVRIS